MTEDVEESETDDFGGIAGLHEPFTLKEGEGCGVR
jgi:hypothetical protein